MKPAVLRGGLDPRLRGGDGPDARFRVPPRAGILLLLNQGAARRSIDVAVVHLVGKPGAVAAPIRMSQDRPLGFGDSPSAPPGGMARRAKRTMMASARRCETRRMRAIVLPSAESTTSRRRRREALTTARATRCGEYCVRASRTGRTLTLAAFSKNGVRVDLRPSQRRLAAGRRGLALRQPGRVQQACRGLPEPRMEDAAGTLPTRRPTAG